MARYFQIEDAALSITKIREVWIKDSRDKTLFTCFTKEALDIAVKALEMHGFINVTDKPFTDFNLED